MASFDTCVAFTLEREGGLSTDPGDPGNWTGGAIGKGACKGTKFGISAAAYPDTDIATLTEAEARSIYRRDYWEAIDGDSLPPAVAAVMFDAAVNNGVRRAAMWLQHAVHVPEDGKIGPQTLAAVQAAKPLDLAADILAARMTFMTGLADWSRFGAGWARRLTQLAFFAAGL